MTTDKTAASEPKVDLSLDDLEKERPRDPFRIAINKRTIELSDPQDIDWLDLADLEDDPARFVVLCMSEDDAEFFLAQALPSWKMNTLMESFMRHYGLGGRVKGRGSRR